MPMTTSQYAGLLKEGIDEVVKTYETNSAPLWKGFANEVETSDPYYRIASIGGLPPASIVNEATGIPELTIPTPYYRDTPLFKRAAIISVSDELLTRIKYGVMRDRADMMAESLRMSEELDIAGFMNLATTGDITTPDNMALVSNAHLTAVGFFSNILTNNPPLSYTALEQAVQELMVQPDHQGFPRPYTGSLTLHVAPSNAMLAERLTSPGRIPQSNDNDRNVVAPRFTAPMVNPLFTNPAAWMVTVAAPGRKNPFLMITQGGRKMATQYSISKDVHIFQIRKIWGKGARDGRGFVYSSGAGV